MTNKYGERMCDTEMKKEADAGGGWRPIETAPKDGTRVLLFEPITFLPAIGHWKDKNRGGKWEYEGWTGDGPTHWQPLPPPPAVSEPPKDL